MNRPRAADDFEVIRERLEELRREREDTSPNDGSDDAASTGNNDDGKDAAERQAHCEGAPPAWVPTIFLPQPTD